MSATPLVIATPEALAVARGVPRLPTAIVDYCVRCKIPVRVGAQGQEILRQPGSRLLCVECGAAECGSGDSVMVTAANRDAVEHFMQRLRERNPEKAVVDVTPPGGIPATTANARAIKTVLAVVMQGLIAHTWHEKALAGLCGSCGRPTAAEPVNAICGPVRVCDDCLAKFEAECR